MRIERDPDIQTFLKRAGPFLKSEPAIHSFILSTSARLAEAGKPVALLARAVHPGGQTAVAAIQTRADSALVLSTATEPDIRIFAERLAALDIQLPGVTGPAAIVDLFAQDWRGHRQCTHRDGPNLRLFILKQVIPPNGVPGHGRLATASDRETIFRWIRAFQVEAVPNDPPVTDEEVYREIDESTAAEKYFIWEDHGKPVCLLGSKRETSTERWIAPVYTPPECRGRGYASGLVAMVSERIVKSGKQGMLFTDLANPTSNSIYQKVGYRPVADFKHVFFV